MTINHWEDRIFAYQKFGPKWRDFKSLIDYKFVPLPSVYCDNLLVENYLVTIHVQNVVYCKSRDSDHVKKAHYNIYNILCLCAIHENLHHFLLLP